MRYKISFVVPVYNRQSTIARCIDSVIAAEREDLQLVIVDDCSTDSSINVVQSYTDKYDCVKLIRCDSNGGPGIARNVGIEYSEGEYLFFLDSDDILVTSSIEMLVNALCYDVDILLFNTRVYWYGKDIGSYTSTVMRTVETMDNVTMFDDFDNDVSTYLWRYCFKRDFIQKNGICFPDYYYGEDACFVIQAISCANVFGSLAEEVYRYIGAESDSEQLSQIKHPDMHKYTDAHIALCDEKLASSREENRMWLANMKNRFLWRCLKESRDVLPGELNEEIYLFSLELKRISQPIWFMTIGSLGLLKELETLFSFNVGGFLDNSPTNENARVKDIRDKGYKVCFPQEAAASPCAVVLLCENYLLTCVLMDQLGGLGWKLVYESGRYSPRLYKNFTA